MLGLTTPTAGSIEYKGKSIVDFKGKELKAFRHETGMIFQDPYASLNPRMTAGAIITEPLEIHKILKGPEKKKRLEELLKLVGLQKENASRFPHEFSGGQKQRIGIARALATNP
ncbi:MAG: Oligopeptide transport ATP-binding protein OppF, partial [Chlamydiae bacterium]|nr:Oligopeptide transport ATP-binding protein OppF [Chlamydiota bacterium]